MTGNKSAESPAKARFEGERSGRSASKERPVENRRSVAFHPPFDAPAFRSECQRAFDLYRPYLPEISPEQEEQLLTYLALVAETNRSLNLTAISKAEDMLLLHLIDSWTLLPLLDRELEAQAQADFRFLDIGSGAGFPGIPLKLLRPQIELCMLDALQKRIHFLQRAIGQLALNHGCTALHARAEEAGRLPEYRDRFDLVTARAVADLPLLLELALPFVKPGGLFIAMKAEADEEIRRAEKAARLLSAVNEEVCELELADSGVKRKLILYRKLRPCPSRYPRTFAKMKKAPLG